QLGATSLRETVAGVHAEAPAEFAYRVCLWSRFANRLLLPLARAEVDSAEALYQAALAIPWHEHFSGANTLPVDFAGKSDASRHAEFGAQQTAYAIVHHLLARGDMRASVDLKNPDIRVNAYLAKGRGAISLDLAGESLRRRGYRVAM